jgi:hemerythrin-like domain-containing protein
MSTIETKTITTDGTATPTNATATARPDASDMLIVHRVFRRELALLPRMVEVTRPHDVRRIAEVGAWAGLITGVLHHHHENEDELLWPRLLERAPMDARLVQRMEAQHAVVAGVLAQVDDLLLRWMERGDEVSRNQLAVVLAQVGPALRDHLAEEEAFILPMVERHLTAAEYGELGERGRAALPQETAMLFLGAMLEEATQREEQAVLAEMPMPARAAWTVAGRRAYGKAMRSLRSGI